MIIGSGEGENTASALFRKSLDEMEYLIKYFRGKKETVHGLAGVGDLYVSAVGGRNSKMGEYLGKGHTFNMFDCQAWFARDVIMGKIQMPSADEINKDINKWVAMEEKLENPDQMIDFQTEYTKELHDMSDYPKIDFELIRKHFKEWEHHKVEDILTYRNKSFSSPVTGSVAPIHHTPWETAMDDSMKTFLNK